MQFIENEGLGKLSLNRPYWFGEAISLVDLTFYPWFERWSAIEHYRGFKLSAEFSRIQQWWNAVSQRESVKEIANSKEFYLERYARFAEPFTKKVSEELSSAGQVTPEQLQQAAQQGFKSVLNLRSPQEQGFLNDEEQHALSAGLNYANVPLNPSESNPELVEKAIWEIQNLPSPVLVHCAAGARATAIALIATASQQKLTPDEIKLKAQELGLNLNQPHLKQFLQQAE